MPAHLSSILLAARRACAAATYPSLAPLGRVGLLLFVASGCAGWHAPRLFARSAAAASRSQVPKPGPAVAFHVPAPTTSRLSNELTVLVVPRTQLPLVQAALVLQGGSAADPVGQEGISALLAEAAKLGTAKRNAGAIAEQMEMLGASLDASVAAESTTFATQALKHTLPQALEIMADVAMHPAFAAAEVARARASQLAELEQLASSPAATAHVLSRKLVFGSHPYGHISHGTIDAVAKLDARALVRHHEQTFLPAKAALVLTGDIDVATAHSLAEQYFGSWRASPRAMPMAPVPTPEAQSAVVAVVDRPGAPQAECHLSSLGISRDAPDYPALVLANAILGGMFNSRINMNLREAKGWTYGARATLTPMQSQGLLTLQSAIRADVAAEGIGEILAEADKMQGEEVSQDELKAAKNRHVLSVAGRLETLEQLATLTAEQFVYGLPDDYWQTLPKKLNAVRVADVLSAARAHIVPSQFNVTVVGDRASLEAKLLNLGRGPITTYDARGNLVPEGAGAARRDAPPGKAAGPR